MGGPARNSAHFTLSPEALQAIAQALAELLNERPRDEPWIGVDAAAEHLACKRQRIYDLVSKDAIPYVKEGSRLLFRRTALDAHLGGCGKSGGRWA